MDERQAFHLASLLGSAPVFLVWIAALGLAIGAPSLGRARVKLAVAALLELGNRIVWDVMYVFDIWVLELDGVNAASLAAIVVRTLVGSVPHATAIALLLLALWQTARDRQPTHAAGQDPDPRNFP